MDFSEKLLQLRRARGLSQEQLAERLDVSRQAVSKWETGEALPETDKLLRLGDFFAVTLDSLLRPDCALCARTPDGAGEAPPQGPGGPGRSPAEDTAARPADSAAAPVAANPAGDPAAPAAASAMNTPPAARAAAVPVGVVRIVCWALLVLGSCLLVALGNDGAAIWYWPFLHMLPGFALQLLAVTLFEVDIQRRPLPARPAERLLFWAPALPQTALLPLWLLGGLAMRVTTSESFGFLVLLGGMAVALAAGVRCYLRYLVKAGRRQPTVW